MQDDGAGVAAIEAAVEAGLEAGRSRDWRMQERGLGRISELARQGFLAHVGYACAGAVVERVAQLLAEGNVKVMLQALEVCAMAVGPVIH